MQVLARTNRGYAFCVRHDAVGGQPTDKADIVMSNRDEPRWRVKHDDSSPSPSPSYLRNAVEGLLTRLKLERLDLFLIHRPDPCGY